ncbi:MAG TPA: hypothetical protein VLL76_11870 [Candidatus Omnitrophota bacterium]|nr:hypothetical protein [Candidatus Omnitrophota bacterium]
MLTEALLVLAVSASAPCRLDALDLRHGFVERDQAQEYRLSRAEDQCWTEPERGRQELDSLRGEWTLHQATPRPPPVWRGERPSAWDLSR